MLELHPELGEIVAAVAELLGERIVMNIRIVLPEEPLGIGDQRVEMAFLIIRRGGNALEQRLGRMHIASGMPLDDNTCHVAYVLALIGIFRKRHCESIE